VPFPNCVHEERTLNFRTLTKSFFGPAYATTRKVQRVAKLSTKFIVIENKTELFDIPFCDRFFVVERWVVETETQNLDTLVIKDGHKVPIRNKTKLNVEVELFMTGNCTWEKQIRSKSLMALKEGISAWGVKATQALDFTTKNKLKRLCNNKIPSRKNAHLDPECGSAISTRENDSEVLMKIHRAQLEKLEKKIKAGDSEWSDIEIRHYLNAGKGSAFAEVLDQNGLPLHREELKENVDIGPIKTNKKSKKSMLRLLKRRSK